MRTEDPDGIRTVQVKVPCRPPSAPLPPIGVTAGTTNRLL